MKITRAAVNSLVLIASMLMGLAVVVAQSHTSTHQPQQKAPELEVFCSHLSTGQLCLSAAPNVLKLDDAQKARWSEAARQYNKAVDAATKQFLEQSKPILSADQFGKMQKWFDTGLNPVLNQILIPQSGGK